MKTKINHEAIFKLAIKGFNGIAGGPNAVYKLAKATAPHAARKNTAKQQKGCALFGILGGLHNGAT